MLTYEIDLRVCAGEHASDDLWRMEFRAPVNGHDGVLVWIDNMPREAAIAVARRWRTSPAHRVVWCRRCPGPQIPSPHEHDALPEEQGWVHSEMANLRIMPMREAC
jgi:hypothetical protein